MSSYKIQLIETGVAFLVFLILRFTTQYFVRITVVKSLLKNNERKDVTRLINLILFVVFTIIIVAIWSVKQDHILVVASSLLTVFGVALFAEMSILSNITACLILFFQHPIKVGDTICVLHEGSEVEGELIDITYFFLFIKTSHRGILTIPNSVLLKTSFYVISKDDAKPQ